MIFILAFCETDKLLAKFYVLISSFQEGGWAWTLISIASVDDWSADSRTLLLLIAACMGNRLELELVLNDRWCGNMLYRQNASERQTSEKEWNPVEKSWLNTTEDGNAYLIIFSKFVLALHLGPTLTFKFLK